MNWIDDAWVDTGEQHGFVGRLLRPGADRCEACQTHASQETKDGAPARNV